MADDPTLTPRSRSAVADIIVFGSDVLDVFLRNQKVQTWLNLYRFNIMTVEPEKRVLSAQFPRQAQPALHRHVQPAFSSLGDCRRETDNAVTRRSASALWPTSRTWTFKMWMLHPANTLSSLCQTNLHQKPNCSAPLMRLSTRGTLTLRSSS